MTVAINEYKMEKTLCYRCGKESRTGFKDKALKDMSLLKPRNNDEFLLVSGVWREDGGLWAKISSQIPEKGYPKETISMPQSIKFNDFRMFPVSADYWLFEVDIDEFEIEEQIFQYFDRILALLTIKDERMRDLE